MSDVTGLVLAVRSYAAAQRAVGGAKGDDAIAAARAKRRESWYSMLKLMADVATYFPQCGP